MLRNLLDVMRQNKKITLVIATLVFAAGTTTILYSSWAAEQAQYPRDGVGWLIGPLHQFATDIGSPLTFIVMCIVFAAYVWIVRYGMLTYNDSKRTPME